VALIEEIGTYLQTCSTSLFKMGTNLFLNGWAETTVVTTVITETGGGASAQVCSTGLPAWERPSFQVVCRSTAPTGGEGAASSTGARARAEVAWRSLHLANTSLSGAVYLRVEPEQKPFLLDRDDRGRVRFAFNVSCSRVST